MQGACGQLLAGAGFTGDQHRQIRGRRQPDVLVHRAHRRAVANQRIVVLVWRLWRFGRCGLCVGAAQQRTLHHFDDVGAAHRLDQMIEGTQRHCFDGVAAGHMRGEHHQRYLPRLRIVQARAQHRDAIHARHAEIHERHVDPAFAQPRQTVGPVVGRDHRVPERAQCGL